jgi:peptidoglycan/xylan/chitin deacetylase (PgdA/CDA1 family)
MRRRKFIKIAGLSSMGSLVSNFNLHRYSPTSHYISFSFDDGFRKSFLRAAELHEEYGLKAALNVIATGHLPDFKVKDAWIENQVLGDFDDWNNLVGRGHSVMPHTWQHLNLTKIPIAQARENIDKCLEYFENNLDGYKGDDAVYHFAYNASNDELHEHALTKVRAVRTSGRIALNEQQYNLNKVNDPAILGCWANGPDICDEFLEKTINDFLDSDGGWLILNLHGFDNEGWGPVSTKYYDGLLKKLVNINHVKILPEAEVLKLESTK